VKARDSPAYFAGGNFGDKATYIVFDGMKLRIVSFKIGYRAISISMEAL